MRSYCGIVEQSQQGYEPAGDQGGRGGECEARLKQNPAPAARSRMRWSSGRWIGKLLKLPLLKNPSAVNKATLPQTLREGVGLSR